MTVAIYEKTDQGLIRLGTFTPRKYYSVVDISRQFMKRHPKADPSKLFIVRRIQQFGRYVDNVSGAIPFDMEPVPLRLGGSKLAAIAKLNKSQS